MRIWPSESTVMKRKVGSIVGIHDLEVQAVALVDRLPVGGAGAAERIHARDAAGVANGLHIHDDGRSLTYGCTKSCGCVVDAVGHARTAPGPRRASRRR